MLDPYEAEIRLWLAAQPALPTVAIIRRLMEMAPATFSEKNTRRIQIIIKGWRAEITREIIMDGRWSAILPTWPSASAEGQVDEVARPIAGNIAL